MELCKSLSVKYSEIRNFFSKSAPDIIHHGESREKSVVMLGHFQPWAELSQQKRITNKKYLVAELRKFVL